MGDAGDYWNDHREYKRRKRREMEKCLGCQRLVFPGEKCMDCETVAPGGPKKRTARKGEAPTDATEK